MNFSPAEIFFFSDEIQKAAGMPAPQARPQPEKKKNILTRNVGLGTLAATGLAAGLALKNPATAGKYLSRAGEVFTKPGRALSRGFRSGSMNVAKGTAGGTEAAAKRVSQYQKVIGDAAEGRLRSVQALDDIAAGTQSARARGFGSVGTRMGAAGELKLSDDLAKRVSEAQDAFKAGKPLDESVLQGLYKEIQQAGSGLKTSKGLGYYLPGERTAMLGLGGGFGASAGLQKEDPETGRKRGIAERIARGTVGATTGMMLTPLYKGLGAGALLPAAVSMGPLTAASGIAGDVAGGGGALVDKAFGQKS